MRSKQIDAIKKEGLKNKMKLVLTSDRSEIRRSQINSKAIYYPSHNFHHPIKGVHLFILS